MRSVGELFPYTLAFCLTLLLKESVRIKTNEIKSKPGKMKGD